MIKVVTTVPYSRFQQFGILFPEDWDVAYLEDPAPETLLENTKDADFLFVRSLHSVTEEIINAAKKLRLIHTEGVAYNTVDIEAAAKKGIPVCNNQGVNNKAVAEHTIGLMLASLRRIAWADSEIKRGNYAACQKKHRSASSRELGSLHIGLVGLGAIGREVARRLIPFGCKVSYHDIVRSGDSVEEELNVEYTDLNSLLTTCDVISLHVPVTPSTARIISSDQLNVMKPGALLINASRGELVDQEALAAALEEGRVCAALDTVTPEPLNSDSPLITLSPEASSRLVITPHIAGTTDEAFTGMLSRALENMRRVLRNEPLQNVVNEVEYSTGEEC